MTIIHSKLKEKLFNVVHQIGGRLPFGSIQAFYFIISRALLQFKIALMDLIDSLYNAEIEHVSTTARAIVEINKSETENKKPGYIIYALNYSRQSAGIYCLYKLCHDLNSAGETCFMTWTNYSPPDLYTPVISTRKARKLAKNGYVVIYPEIISGNPLCAKHVVRWILNKPGVLGGDLLFSNKDIIFIYANAFARSLSNLITGKLFLPTIDETIFYDDNRTPTERSLVCYYIGKSKWIDGYFSKTEAFEITRTSPKRSELGKLFRASRVLYCFDNTTILVYEAIMCGCPVVLIPDGTQTLEDYQNSELGMNGINWGIIPEQAVTPDTHAFKIHYASVKKEYYKQLDVFIKKTRPTASA
jgi:hypothetical protein